jgi:hypothetical protein
MLCICLLEIADCGTAIVDSTVVHVTAVKLLLGAVVTLALALAVAVAVKRCTNSDAFAYACGATVAAVVI